MNRALRWLRNLVWTLLALLLLFEEWGWEPLAALVRWLARLPVLRWIERQIGRLPPWAALLVLLTPALGLLPFKLLALYLFAHGQVVAGVAMLLTAKLVGTALVARLFQLVLPALLQLGWFARWYPRWKTWKDRIMDRIRQSPPWQTARAIKFRVRSGLAGWWRSLRG